MSRDSSFTKGIPEALQCPPQGVFLDDDGAGGGGRAPGEATILVVEDHQQVMDLAVSALRDVGYRVLQAISAEEALARAEEVDELDLLFSDIVMPGGVNGLILAHQLIRKRPLLKVLITTGYGDSAARIQSGICFEILQKPYRIADLQNAVRNMLTVG